MLAPKDGNETSLSCAGGQAPTPLLGALVGGRGSLAGAEPAAMAAWLRLSLRVGGASCGEAWRTPLHMHPAAPPADAPARRCSSDTEGGALGMDESRDALAEAAGLGSARPSAMLSSEFSAWSLPRICWSCWCSATDRCSSFCSSNDHSTYTPTSVGLILVCSGAVRCDRVAKMSSLWNDANASSSTRERRAAARASIMHSRAPASASRA
mmetsp:Transcript_21165/g.53862  ORF Transcript_21165/g.53862 Transcript_21165/m.53862 type:complete len:210 (+) Transcript_21165:2813-3442(+)